MDNPQVKITEIKPTNMTVLEDRLLREKILRHRTPMGLLLALTYNADRTVLI